MSSSPSSSTRAPGLAPIGTPGYRICIAVAGSSLPDLMENAERALAESRLLELRLDSLAGHVLLPRAVDGAIAGLLACHPALQLVATCRRTIAGGGFAATVEQELEILLAVAAAGCTIVDLALESAEELGPARMQAVRAALAAHGAALMVSFHDYEATRQLPRTLARLRAQQPDVVKLVSTARTVADNLPVLALLAAQQDRPLVAIAMGEAGLPSRVLGLRAGALFTFAAASPGAGTAPGQLDAPTLRDLYRAEALGPATRIFGVAGLPITHSLSPLVHNTAFAAEGLDAVFLPLPTGSAEELLQMVRALPLDGVSVTMPLKQAVLPLLDQVDPLAARVGACNTIVRTPEGALHGYNTDVAGVVDPLAERLALRGARVLVQGAGGAARAAVFGLLAEGAEVWIANRTHARARALADEAGALLFNPSLDEEILGGMRFDALVNATPLGMTGHARSGEAARASSQSADRDAFADAGSGDPRSYLDKARLVFDMVYNPIETPLLRQARAQGLPVISGLEMFVHQAASQFALWTGRPAPIKEMTRVAHAALVDREATLSHHPRDGAPAAGPAGPTAADSDGSA